MSVAQEALNSRITGLFGVLYTVSKEKAYAGWLFLLFKLTMDWNQ
jgi:hypothetical protein